jgi:hypothetical protein
MTKELIRGYFMALLTAQADLAQIKGLSWTSSEVDHLDARGREVFGGEKWIMYPLEERAKLEETIVELTRLLASAAGVPLSYPPV